MRIHSTSAVVERDKKKKMYCENMGITLITVPYWWDANLSSLATTIHTRPDIQIPEILRSTPIPVVIPET